MTRDGDREIDPLIGAGEDIVYVLDAEQTCLSVNGAFLQAFDKLEEEVVGRRASDAEGRESFGGLVEDVVHEALAGASVSTQRWWDFPCLGFRFVRIGLEPVRDALGRVGGANVCVRDLTDARLAQDALEESEQRFEDFAGIVADFFWELDENLRFVYLSARFEQIMGMPKERVLGRRRIELFPGEDHASATTRNHHLDLEQRRPFDGYQFTHVLDDGSKRGIRMSGTPVLDERGHFRGYRGVASDVSDSQRMESRIAHLATHDALTDLVNRQELVQRLHRVVDTASVGDSAHGLCYVDVDRFRSINDRCGHSAGDRLLVELAALLRTQIRKRDTLARVGGNAFAILMEHCSLDQIERVAEGVQRAISEFDFEGTGEPMRLTVTIGVVPIDADTQSIDRVLRAADRACYAAKSAGGDRILVYGRPDQQATRERRRSEPVAEDN